MNLNNFTIKAQEAVQQAVQLVTKNNQQVIEPVHLLKAVIMTGESVTNFIFQKLGVNAQNLNMVLGSPNRSYLRFREANPISLASRTLSYRRRSIIPLKWGINMYRWSRSSWRCSRKRAPLHRY